MVFVQDDHAVEKFATYGTDNTLGCPVLPWAPECGPLWIDLEALDRTRDCRRENRVVVVDQVSMGWFIGSVSRSCWITQRAVGFPVTLKWRIHRCCWVGHPSLLLGRVLSSVRSARRSPDSL